MARPIDADALKEDLTRFYDNEVTARRLIDEQPTIYAVPVTWLRNLCAIAKMETDDEMFIDWLIQTWHEEQEAR